MKVHILDDWHDTLRGLPSFRRLDGHEVTVWTDAAPDVETLAARLAEAQALVLFRERTAIGADLLSRLPRLRLVAMRGSHPHVDVAACSAHGVVFCSNTAAEGANLAAAELTFGLILAAARRIPQQMASLAAGRWQLAPGQSLDGRRLGLWGYGRIGRQVAHYARAFGMEVVWWASETGRARAAAAGETVAPSRDAFFEGSDVVSLHVRLTPQTRGLVTAADLARMKPSSIFVNTSRAGLVAPGALLTALDAGRPGGAALDVFDEEPLPAGDPLATHPNVVATPHIGFVTVDELDRQFAEIYAQVTAFAEGAPVNVVNPEALGR